MNKVNGRGIAAKPLHKIVSDWLDAHPKATIALVLIGISIVPGIIETFLP